MYNRYVPQADGSFRRSRFPEQLPHREQRPPAPQEPARQDPPVQPENTVTPPPKQTGGYRNPPPVRKAPPCEPAGGSVGSFLKGLLPQNFDTEDLIVVLLLLLMSGHSGVEQNGALMTLVIYLFL